MGITEKFLALFKSRYFVIAFLVLLLILTRLMFYGPFFDDGFIYFRYISNLVHGHGLVYNIGERVASNTSPFFTLLLIPIGFLRLPLPLASAVISMVFDLATLLIFIEFCNYLKLNKYLTAAIIGLFLLDGWFTTFAISGLETSLYVFLIMLSFYLFALKKQTALGLVMGLLLLTRLDSLLLIGLFMALNLYLEKRIPKSWFLFPIFIFGAWEVFSFLYFHTFIPDSLKYKIYLEHFGSFAGKLHKIDFAFGFNFYNGFYSALRYFGYLKSSLVSIGLILVAGLFNLLLMAVALIPIFSPKKALEALDARQTALVRLLGAWVFLYNGFFIVSGAATYSWYFMSTLLPYFFLLTLGFKSIFKILASPKWYLNRTISHYAPTVFLVGLILAVFFSTFVLTKANFDHARFFIERDSIPAAKWLSQNVGPGQIVGESADGMIGYFAPNVTMLDLHGLVSPAVREFRREQHLKFTDTLSGDYGESIVANHFRPDYILTAYGKAFQNSLEALGSKNLYKPVSVFGNVIILKLNE